MCGAPLTKETWNERRLENTGQAEVAGFVLFCVVCGPFYSSDIETNMASYMFLRSKRHSCLGLLEEGCLGVLKREWEEGINLEQLGEEIMEEQMLAEWSGSHMRYRALLQMELLGVWVERMRVGKVIFQNHLRKPSKAGYLLVKILKHQNGPERWFHW